MFKAHSHTETKDATGNGASFFNNRSHYPALQLTPQPAAPQLIQRQEDDEASATDAPQLPVTTRADSPTLTSDPSDFSVLSSPALPRLFGYSPLSKDQWTPHLLSPGLMRLQLPNSPATAPPPRNSGALRSEALNDPNYPIIPAHPISESRHSIFEGKRYSLRQLPGLSYLSFQEIAPPQHRLQWGQPTYGARLDSYSALRIGNEQYHFDFGMRSTNVSSDGGNQMPGIENQRVGFASMKLSWLVLSYWNDHGFWWWPLADKGDKGDTAGLKIGLTPDRGLPVGGNWKLTHISLSLRMASGDPVRGSEAEQGGRSVYQEVIRPDISRGDLTLSTQLTTPQGLPLEAGFGISSGALRHFAQSIVVHRTLGIPEFARDDHFAGYFYLRGTFGP